jgi:hypothetical protein
MYTPLKNTNSFEISYGSLLKSLNSGGLFADLKLTTDERTAIVTNVCDFLNDWVSKHSQEENSVPSLKLANVLAYKAFQITLAGQYHSTDSTCDRDVIAKSISCTAFLLLIPAFIGGMLNKCFDPKYYIDDTCIATEPSYATRPIVYSLLGVSGALMILSCLVACFCPSQYEIAESQALSQSNASLQNPAATSAQKYIINYLKEQHIEKANLDKSLLNSLDKLYSVISGCSPKSSTPQGVNDAKELALLTTFVYLSDLKSKANGNIQQQTATAPTQPAQTVIEMGQNEQSYQNPTLSLSTSN